MDAKMAKKKKNFASFNIISLVLLILFIISTTTVIHEDNDIYLPLMILTFLFSIYYIYFTIDRFGGSKYDTWQGILFGSINVFYILSSLYINFMILGDSGSATRQIANAGGMPTTIMERVVRGLTRNVQPLMFRFPGEEATVLIEPGASLHTDDVTNVASGNATPSLLTEDSHES